MKARPSLRMLAQKLGLSVATVSMALRNDPRISEPTAKRVKRLAEGEGYFADPVVSEGLSRARRKQFTRDKLIWLQDAPRKEFPWLESMYEGALERGQLLGYDIEFGHAESPTSNLLKGLPRTWKARGIQGVILGPFLNAWAEPPFPWDDFVWLEQGNSMQGPTLNRVGRDHESDCQKALAYLKSLGCERIGFVDRPKVQHLFQEDLIRIAAVEYHRQHESPAQPYFLHSESTPRSTFKTWLRQNRIDGLILTQNISIYGPDFPGMIAPRPNVTMTLVSEDTEETGFLPNYTIQGESMINLMHHLLISEAYGIPTFRQQLLIASLWQEAKTTGGS